MNYPIFNQVLFKTDVIKINYLEARRNKKTN